MWCPRQEETGMYNSTIESLKKLSDIFLTTAESSTGSKDNSWEDPAKNAPQQPVLVQQVQTLLSQLSANLLNTTPATPPEQDIPTFQETIQPEPEPTEVAPPKWVSKEVAALGNIDIIGNNDSSAKQTLGQGVCQ